MCDLLLKNAKILTGNLEPVYSGDIGIKNGNIDKLGKVTPGENTRIINCENKYVSPGFIDSHAHEDLVYGDKLPELGKISQGITTVFTGMCGLSLYPTNKKTSQELRSRILSFGKDVPMENLNRNYSYKSYIEQLGKGKSRINYKMLIGHGTLRTAVMGESNRAPSSVEMEAMKKLLREAMEEGVPGLSAGLVYPPGSFSTEAEITELLKVVAEYNGFYSVHLRNESDGVVEAVEEAIRSAGNAEVPLWISHHKIAGMQNWKKSDETLKIIKENIEKGMKITLDIYPYEAASTLLTVVLPPEFLNEGTPAAVAKLKDKNQRAIVKEEIINPSYVWDNFYKNCGGFSGIFIIDSPYNEEAKNMTIADYAEKTGKDEFETFFDLLVENEGNVMAVYFMMNEYDIKKVLTFPETVIGSDGASFNPASSAHPRGYGTFPKVIRKYVLDEQLFSLNEAVYKMTGLPAKKLNLDKKGLIKTGCDADLVVFDLAELKDNATYENPYELSDGIEYVIVDGKIAYRNKELTDVFAGKLI